MAFINRAAVCLILYAVLSLTAANNIADRHSNGARSPRAASETCDALRMLASTSIAQFRCRTNDVCNGIECDATLVQGIGDYRTEVTLLPCEQPLPAISLVFLEPNGDVALITTLNRSASLPLVSAGFSSTVMVTVDQLTDAIGFQVRSTFPGFGVVTVFPYTVIPVDTSNCSTAMDCVPSSVLMLSPRFGNMLGGTAVLVSGPCFDEDDNITCVFDDIPTEGMFFSERQSLCASPILSRTGRLPFQFIVNGTEQFRGDSVFYSVSFTTAYEVEIESDSLLLETGNNINVRWTPESILPQFPPDNYTVDIRLYTVDPMTEVWREVYILASDIPNNGAIDVTVPDVGDIIMSGNSNGGQKDQPPDPAFPLAIQVAASASIVETRPRRGTFANLVQRIVRFPFAKWSFIAYLVIQVAGPSYCKWWNSQQPEGIGQQILDSVSTCPCTVGAACQDSQFKPDNAIAQFIFHFGSTCYRENVVDSKPAPQGPHTATTRRAGNQCCYDGKGKLIPPGKRGAGTVDLVSPEVSVWGHFWADVLPAIACCWAVFADCSSYTKQRPVGDCSGYQPPPPACVFGDPHTVTLDGHMYTFNGKGEFVLIEAIDNRFTLQGRMVEATDTNQAVVPATVFSAIAGKEEYSDTVQFELNNTNQLIALVNGELIDFEGLSEQEFNNVTINDLGNNTFTATYSSGAYLNVREENGILSIVIVSLPRSFQGTTRGLMGSFNGDTSDDLVPRNSTEPVPLNSSLQTIHESFGVTWIIDDPAESLFSYGPGEEWATFYDPDFVPFYEPVFADSNMQMQAIEACGGDSFCLFDIAATGRMEVGLSTLAASQELEEIIEVSRPVVCDPPCENGTCVSNDTCSCSTGFEGERCTEAVSTECDQVLNPCGNGGNCTQFGSTVLCQCLPDFTGMFCEQEIPLQIAFINRSPRVVGKNISVEMNVSKLTSSLTCHIRDVRQNFFDNRNCSLTIVYPNLNAGNYILRIEAKTESGERAVIRRAIRIGRNSADCTVNLINDGVNVQEGMVSVHFTGTGAASFYTCQVDRQPRRQCFSEIPVIITGLSSGQHRFRVVPHHCVNVGIDYRLSFKFTVP